MAYVNFLVLTRNVSNTKPASYFEGGTSCTMIMSLKRHQVELNAKQVF